MYIQEHPLTMPAIYVHPFELLHSYGEACTTYRDIILSDNCHQSLPVWLFYS